MTFASAIMTKMKKIIPSDSKDIELNCFYSVGVEIDVTLDNCLVIPTKVNIYM